jgi:large subunit ribosomal protein L3
MFRPSLLKKAISAAAPVRAAAAAPIAALFSTEAASTDASAGADASSVVFPPSQTARHRANRVAMPTSRGEAWGQVLVSNRDLVLPAVKWTPKSRRAGVVARKVGMLSVFDGHGRQVACTAIQIEDCQVLALNPVVNPNRGTQMLELGACNRKEKSVNKPALGHFHHARVAPKLFVQSVEISPDAALPLGWSIDARHFTAGQYVDVVGHKVGKGFQGGMKRWGFAGLSASHGVSVSHRSIGSTGQRQDPGRVFKNKKMPGHMGTDQKTIHNLQIVKIDPTHNVIYVRGAVPGMAETCLIVRDAVRRPFNPESPPPFPTFVAPSDDDKAVSVIADSLLGPDPFAGGAV